jgi:ribosome biogenesis protein NSA2
MFQGLRFNKAHVTHPELKATFHLPIIGVKKNPTSPMYTSLGVITKGTVIEVCNVLGTVIEVCNVLGTVIEVCNVLGTVIEVCRMKPFFHKLALI